MEEPLSIRRELPGEPPQLTSYCHYVSSAVCRSAHKSEYKTRNTKSHFGTKAPLPRNLATPGNHGKSGERHWGGEFTLENFTPISRRSTNKLSPLRNDKTALLFKANVSGKHDREQFQPMFSPFINGVRLLALASALDCCRGEVLRQERSDG
ncbi:hypothetical protein ROHU_012055 [Labeo rohita]|uniref:Uncharacterized protein n=1 Tax=Labeo rohita TaxID=84645 RepID=A0A498LNB1_LABRO|nr:hypothetical protein ROHU_012055 [Labeo rohita]